MVLRISSYRDYQRIFAGELKFSISGSLRGSDSFASILFFVLIGILMFVSSLQGMFMAWKFQHGICSRLNFGPGIFWDFDFCTHSIIAVT